jgi:hypothetical protein
MKLSMRKLKNSLIALILLLTITATAILVTLPIVNAHDPPINVPTNTFVACVPATVGVGQYTTIIIWVDRYSPTAGGQTGQTFTFQINITQPDGSKKIIGPFESTSALGSDYRTFVPDQIGTYKIEGSFAGATIIPSISVPTHVDIGDYFEPSTSEPAYLTVQQSQILSWPEPPLPTDYWTRPINAQNRGWSTLASNWLKGQWLLPGNFQNEGTGPVTAHVLWTEPIEATSLSTTNAYPGGIADAQWPGLNSGLWDYDYAYNTPIIMNGIIYYNMPYTAMSNHYGYYAVDLYTGQRFWTKNGTDNGLNQPYSINLPGGNGQSYGQNYEVLTTGQMLHVNNVNGHGIASYLWMQGQEDYTSAINELSTWYMLDATTGNVILTLINVPTSGYHTTDAQGDILIYSYNAAAGRFLCWNTTQAIYPAGPTGTNQQVWRPPIGATIDAVADRSWMNASITWGTTLDPLILQALAAAPHSGYSMNYSDSSLKGLPGTLNVLSDTSREPVGFFGYSIPSTYTGATAPCSADYFNIWLAHIDQNGPYSPWPTLPSTLNNNHGFTVTLDYNKSIQVPLPGKNYTFSLPVINYDADVFFIACQQTRQEWCYQLSTGNLLWGPTIQKPQISYYSSGGASGVKGNVYYGIYLGIDASNYNGQIYAYNVTNGNLLWIYNATAAPYSYESEYGANMPLMLGAVCDGRVYCYSTEHSPTNPLWRESYVRCINITDGTEIWKIECFYALYSTSGLFAGYGIPIVDGYAVLPNAYDNFVYCIGKGSSGTSVNTPLNGITAGNSFTITGAVTDRSPGAVAYANKYGLVNGVPAVSDQSQEGFMEYLYEQQAKPSNLTGVLVKIDAIDPNGNYINLGSTTTDSNGYYNFQVNPSMLAAGEGTYQVNARFEGTNSYRSSNAESAFTINPAPTVMPTATPQSNLATTTDLEIYIVAGVIAIIIAIAIVGALILRKHP